MTCAHADEMNDVGRFTGPPDDDIPIVTERWRKSRFRLSVDEDEESDVTRANEEPLVGSMVRTGTDLANVDTRPRSAVMSASRRSLI